MGDMEPQLENVEQTSMNSDSGKKLSVVKIRFDLDNPVSDAMYQYLSENIIIKTKEIIGKKPIESNQLKIELPIEEIKEVSHTIPLYNFYAAAGTFSEIQVEKNYNLIPVPERYATEDYFACQIIGESMNKIIPNGSVCIFKIYSGGSRDGKIVLVENRDIHDVDFNSSFTVKTYSSQKIISEEGWQHKEILLKPNSYDTSFKDIVIDELTSEQMKIHGEFVSVLD
jgi:SOS-response transcriptional repressor LexA